MDEKYVRWVRDQQFVEARYSCPQPANVFHARGTVIAFTDRPTVTIDTPGGRRVSWIADLVVEATLPPLADIQVRRFRPRVLRSAFGTVAVEVGPGAPDVEWAPQLYQLVRVGSDAVEFLREFKLPQSPGGMFERDFLAGQVKTLQELT